MFSTKSFSEKCLRYVGSVARFLKVALEGPLLLTFLLFVKLQYVAMTRFAYFLFFLAFFSVAFFSVTYLGLLYVSDPVFPTYGT